LVTTLRVPHMTVYTRNSEFQYRISDHFVNQQSIVHIFVHFF